MTAGGLLVVACGALVRELRDVVALHRLPGVTIECLPAALHNRPERIPDEVRRRVERARGRYERILVGYADCGTGGLLDDVCAELGVERLPGAHCYQLFAGLRRFEHVNDPDPSAFYLTDYLARHFDRLVRHVLRQLHEGALAGPEREPRGARCCPLRSGPSRSASRSAAHRSR